MSLKDMSGTGQMVISVGMLRIDRGTPDLTADPTPPQEFLAAENVSLRLLLAARHKLNTGSYTLMLVDGRRRQRQTVVIR